MEQTLTGMNFELYGAHLSASGFMLSCCVCLNVKHFGRLSDIIEWILFSFHLNLFLLYSNGNL